MFWFQDTVREYTTKPVLLSSLVQLPSITCSLGHQQQVWSSGCYNIAVLEQDTHKNEHLLRIPFACC